MLLAGHATRIEVYGSLLLVVIVVSLMCERMAIDRVLIDTLIKDRERPAIIQEQHNSQTINIESDALKLSREIMEKDGQ